ncbi:tyrosine-type recombinase/integrase [Caedibacter taeniospiralis]|uniref:tyrosine-type recombinase/integrase n=1 Tax=Caedibacter taeniospiralis TaxID=28907 RepID=UPI0018EEFD41|nr:tyrosine-type recombinase/integrase [Caedibacter taeniospiralis]
MTTIQRTPVREKAKQLSKQLKQENPDYNYLRELFRHIRKELHVEVDKGTTNKLPYVPTEEEISQYYKVVWQSRNMKYVVIVKTLLYTGVRVSELINIKLNDIDLDSCQIRINKGKGDKDRIVPFPKSFMEVLAVCINVVERKSTPSIVLS